MNTYRSKKRKMSESSAETKKQILESAKKEFLEKGFMNASLRTIASNAGLTTGAMYRHFKDKDDLFCSLVDEAVDVTTKAVMMADVMNHKKFENPFSLEHFTAETETTEALLDYIYKNFDAFTLLLTKASGSKHENFLDEMCELYTKNCEKTFLWMYKQNYVPKKTDKMTMHVVASTFITSFAEIVLHKVPRKNAVAYINNITEFFRYGTMHILGVDLKK